MTDNFTTKEILIRIMNKLDRLDEKVNDTHQQIRFINGRVKMHSKIILFMGGVIVTMVGWVVSNLIN